jgi:hypothetical protein
MNAALLQSGVQQIGIHGRAAVSQGVTNLAKWVIGVPQAGIEPAAGRFRDGCPAIGLLGPFSLRLASSLLSTTRHRAPLARDAAPRHFSARFGSGGVRIVDPVTQLIIPDTGPGRPVLGGGQGPAEFVQTAQHEPLGDHPAVQRVEGGGLPPHLALQPPGGRRKVAVKLRPERIPFRSKLDELGTHVGRFGW